MHIHAYIHMCIYECTYVCVYVCMSPDSTEGHMVPAWKSINIEFVREVSGVEIHNILLYYYILSNIQIDNYMIYLWIIYFVYCIWNKFFIIYHELFNTNSHELYFIIIFKIIVINNNIKFKNISIEVELSSGTGDL